MLGWYLYETKRDQWAIVENGTFYDVKDVVNLVDDQGNKWDAIDYLVAINEQGWIIGNGKINGTTHGFLLKPLP